MADVFVSYVRSDKRRVAAVVERLRAARLSVWWDEDIPIGAAWEESIEQALASARAVVVCWSAAAVLSENVRAEARWAKAHGRLIQLFLDAAEPPLFFGERQGIILDADASLEGPEFQRLTDRLSEVTGTDGCVAAPRTRTIDRRLLLAGGGVAAAAAASGGIWLFERRHAAAGEASIAVMPFANLSGDPTQAYFSDGLAEELRSALSRVPRLKVIGRTSSEKLREEDPTETARKLGVANVLIGSVRRSPATIRINAQLVDGANGSERWSKSYDRAPGDALAIQTEIAEAVTKELSISLGLRQARLIAAGGTTAAAALDFYFRSRALFYTTGDPANTAQALALADAALRIDPNYAEAHAQRGAVLDWQGAFYSTSPDEMLDKFTAAAAAAKRAIAAAPDLAAGYAVLGTVLNSQLRMKEALSLYRQAASLNASDRWLVNYSAFLAKIGRDAEAIRRAAAIRARDPLDPNSVFIEGFVFLSLRHYPQAVATMRRVLTMAPGLVYAHVLISVALLAMRRAHDALAELEHVSPDNVNALSIRTIALGQLGDRAGSDIALRSLAQIGGDAVSFQFAEIHAQRGERDRAFAALDHALTVRDPGLTDLRTDFLLDPIRSDPRFVALLGKLDFP